MPLIKSDHLFSLSVITESGQRLGSIRSFDIDVDTQAIIRYAVKPAGISLLGRDDLLIHARQVVRITEKQMIVHDGVVANNRRREKALKLSEEAVSLLPRTSK